MANLIIGAALLAVIYTVWTLTAGRRVPKGHAPADTAGHGADAVDALFDTGSDAGSLVRLAGRPGTAAVLAELFQRLGLSDEEGRGQLERLGLSPTEPAEVARQDRAGLRVHSGRTRLNDALERALLVGIHLAGVDDDYAGVSDDRTDAETLLRMADEAESMLFGDGRRETYELLGKTCLALQDMIGDGPGADRAAVIRDLLQHFDARLKAVQDEMAADMARMPNSNRLMWGDSRDRRHYYFKMGVTNSLRHSGCLQSLGQLYWMRGVNYDVNEAYDLAARECRVLASADLMDVDRLLTLEPGQVRSLVDRTLPANS